MYRGTNRARQQARRILEPLFENLTDNRVPSTQYPVPSTQYPVPSTQYRVPSAQHGATTTGRKPTVGGLRIAAINSIAGTAEACSGLRAYDANPGRCSGGSSTLPGLAQLSQFLAILPPSVHIHPLRSGHPVLPCSFSYEEFDLRVVCLNASKGKRAIVFLGIGRDKLLYVDAVFDTSWWTTSSARRSCSASRKARKWRESRRNSSMSCSSTRLSPAVRHRARRLPPAGQPTHGFRAKSGKNPPLAGKR